MDTPEHDPHRPMKIAEMANREAWSRLGAALSVGQHIVVAGCAGSGKSCALRLCLAGSISLWFRCSADPSLRDSRDRIKTAARRRGDGITWIVLEHADLLHADAQAFLRRVIETSVGTVRFALEVRDLAAISEPLLSRTVLFNVPPLMDYEIRSEITRRVPSCGPALAALLAGQCGGNVRWAVLQALGGGDGMLDPSVLEAKLGDTWASRLAVLEQLAATGSSPRAFIEGLGMTADWDRPGGADPWAASAAATAASATASRTV